jgi:hypothetical protein
VSQTRVQSITGTSSAAATTVTATFGAGATAGNIILCAVGMDKTSGAITPPSGVWNVVAAQDSASVSTWVAWKTATGGETAITLTRATASVAGDTMFIGEYSDTNTSGVWTILGSASDLTNETTRTVTPSGTTASTSAMGQGVAFFTIDSGQSSTAQPTYSNSYAWLVGYQSSGRGDVTVAQLADVAAGTAATTTQTHTPTADQTSGVIVVFAKISVGGGPVLPFRGGKQWNRRFRHRQRLLSVLGIDVYITGPTAAVVLAAPVGAVSVDITGSTGSLVFAAPAGSVNTGVIGLPEIVLRTRVC